MFWGVKNTFMKLQHNKMKAPCSLVCSSKQPGCSFITNHKGEYIPILRAHILHDLSKLSNFPHILNWEKTVCESLAWGTPASSLGAVEAVQIKDILHCTSFFLTTELSFLFLWDKDISI